MEQDFLDEMIAESTRSNAEFPSLMEEARQRRALLDALTAIRSRSRISQSVIAKRIKTSQSAIARLAACRREQSSTPLLGALPTGVRFTALAGMTEQVVVAGRTEAGIVIE